MIEQGIYFALGCIITALLALMFAPVFWRRALRLTRQRLQLQVPLSMQEILAERDQIRAEFAVELLRLEQAMEKVQSVKAADMAEIGRRSMETVALAEKLAALSKLEAGQQEEIVRLLREAAESDAENGSLRAALHDSEHGQQSWRDRAEAALSKIIDLQTELKSSRAAVASLETRSGGLEMRLGEAERAHAVREKAAEDNLRSRLETVMAHVGRHEAAGVSLRRELDDAKTHIRQVESDLEAARANLEAAREREKASHLSRGLQAEKVRGADRSLNERLELLLAENAALQGALAAARRAGPNVAGAADDSADAELRSTIHALGLAVAKMTRHARTAETEGKAEENPRRAAKEEAPRPVGVA